MREEFYVQRSGRTCVLLAGLLEEAHSRGEMTIDLELLQSPTPGNGRLALVKATVWIEEFAPTAAITAPIRKFCGLGCASPATVEPTVRGRLVSMAEARARGRALREAVNLEALTPEEASAFEQAPAAADAVAMRGEADDAPAVRLSPGAAGLRAPGNYREGRAAG